MGVSWRPRWDELDAPMGAWRRAAWAVAGGPRTSQARKTREHAGTGGGQGAPGRLSDRPGRLLLDGRRRAGTASHTKPLGFRRGVERRVI